MADQTPLVEHHPKGTLLLVALYGLVVVLSWFGVYFLLYLRRGGVTP